MTKLLQPYRPHAFALLRIVTGFLFLWHGTQKLFNLPPAGYEAPAWIVYIAGPIELVGGALVMIGLFASPAAFLCSGMAAAAYWLGHANGGLLPIVNKGELAALYAFVFLFISTYGAGIWSVDAIRGKTSAG
ncbi:DoxX family protein (plasmid) [Tistrella bauzanensis]|uniref:DoxX family protein n=1 Tax=Tistrella arctica TaxID=3133430 RepID=A0ABU9YNX3_9PROT